MDKSRGVVYVEYPQFLILDIMMQTKTQIVIDVSVYICICTHVTEE